MQKRTKSPLSRDQKEKETVNTEYNQKNNNRGGSAIATRLLPHFFPHSFLPPCLSSKTVNAII